MKAPKAGEIAAKLIGLADVLAENFSAGDGELAARLSRCANYARISSWQAFRPSVTRTAARVLELRPILLAFSE
jgi:hypothetical protein